MNVWCFVHNIDLSRVNLDKFFKNIQQSILSTHTHTLYAILIIYQELVITMTLLLNSTYFPLILETRRGTARLIKLHVMRIKFSMLKSSSLAYRIKINVFFSPLLFFLDEYADFSGKKLHRLRHRMLHRWEQKARKLKVYDIKDSWSKKNEPTRLFFFYLAESINFHQIVNQLYTHLFPRPRFFRSGGINPRGLSAKITGDDSGKNFPLLFSCCFYQIMVDRKSFVSW